MGRKINSFDRIKDKYIKKTDSCWNWNGSIHENGYGYLMINYKSILAHRFVYEEYNGKIPNGLCIDHLCRNRKCVNPDHLEAVSHRENTMRGFGPASINNKKEVCKNGHKLSGENLYVTPDKRRQCKSCRRISVMKYNNGGVSCQQF